jgi:polar amino acid transport system substrate-binding protein
VRSTTGSFRKLVAVALVAMIALILAACGSDKSDDTSSGSAPDTTATTDSSLASTVPAEVRDRGVLKIATINFPPAAFRDASGELTGWEVELGRGIGRALGIDVEFEVIDFAAVIPGLQAHKYDMAMGDILIDAERLEIVDMVSSHEAFEAFGALSSSELDLRSWLDVCGKKVAFLIGGHEVQDAQAAQRECRRAGKPAIVIQQYQSQPDVNLALQSGRADLTATDNDSISYVISQTGGRFKRIGRYGPSILTGVAISKSSDSEQLARAVQAALQQMIEDGSYTAIFEEFNQGLGGIPADLVQVNPTRTIFEEG